MSKQLSKFRPATRNANKHSARGLGALQKSIQSDGWIGAMTTAADGEMIAGSARIETAAQVFGTDAEPIIVESDGTRPVVVVRKDIPNADDKRAQRLALADNRVQEIDLSWDVEVLAGFDADVLGELWTPDELSDLGQQWADEQRGKQEDAGAQIDKAEELRVKWGVESGQLWQLGDHRLICGDCTDKATVERVMQGERAAVVFADPPFGISYTGHGASVDGRANKFAPIHGDDKPSVEWLLLCLPASDGAIYLKTSWAVLHDWEAALSGVCNLRSRIVWDKCSHVAGDVLGGYATQSEIVLFGSLEKHKINQFDTDVWRIARATTGSPELRTGHPYESPVELPQRAINNSSRAGDLILDPFLGSGTTLIACERLGRKCRAVEISPGYCGVAIERWHQTTGGTPVLVIQDGTR